jgi:2-oxoglutarate dehydrogenase E1 component
MDYSFISNAHPAYIEGLYKQYQEDPSSVADGWKDFFAGFDYALKNNSGDTSSEGAEIPTLSTKEFAVLKLINAYRHRGHLSSTTNPIRKRRFHFQSLDLEYYGLSKDDLQTRFLVGSELKIPSATLEEIIARLKIVYCGNIGFEFAHINNRDKYQWLLDRIEARTKDGEYGLSIEKKHRILDKLNGATGFENFLGKKYVAQKRFGLEGGESAIHALDGIINRVASQNVEEVVIGMAHRGRLNVLANIMGKTYQYIFSEFEGNTRQDDVEGDGDVKYHLGFSSQIETPEGLKVNLKLIPNPSHLEAVNPVVEGFTRAKADVLYHSEYDRILPILIHGDAAIAGQGIIHEIVQMSQLEGYYTGGTIHFVINNQIGFTTDYEDGRSSTYCTGVAGLVEAPAFHVNGDDAEAVLFIAELAADYRQEFNNDVFIDMVCYRKHGHNEGDDPKFTQPQFYELIKKHKNPRTIYSEKLIASGTIEATMAKEMNKKFDASLQEKLSLAKETTPDYQLQTPEVAWNKLQKYTSAEDFLTSPQTGVKKAVMSSILETLQTTPDDFTPLPKLKRLLKRSQELIDRGLVDWSMGEHLAYGTLLVEGHDIRLTGQDVKRGTFSHRNAVLWDAKTNEQYNRLDHLAEDQGKFRIHNSFLSEYAVLGFEFGYSLASPDPLVLWEAQFGDFANGAQIMFDQFIFSCESKWQRQTGLVLLLPHGYEGQGPEHSSARLERFLQASAEFNMTVANVTTPANFFHLIRRQQARPFRKPLVIMSPKKLLRPRNLNRPDEEVLYKECVSSLDEFAKGSFQEVYDDPKIKTKKLAKKVKRVLFCTGKIYYDLLDAKVADSRDDVAIVRIEQLYPFPKNQVQAVIDKYNDAELYWVQEEPSNMGAWQYILAFYHNYKLQLVARKSSASPATGFKKVHESQQNSIVLKAFRGLEELTSPQERRPETGVERTYSKDDLNDLKGMEREVIEQLKKEGITSFHQLSKLSIKEVEKLNRAIPEFGAKFKRFDWKMQANLLE